MSECGVCSTPTGDGALLCADHADRLLADLHAVPAVLADLALTLARQDNMRGLGRAVGKSTETPLPWNDRVPARITALESALVVWSKALTTGDRHARVPRIPTTRDPKDPARLPMARSTAVLAARVLADRIDDVRLMPHADVAYSDVSSAVRAARRVVDRPMDRRYVGQCSAALEDGGLCDVDLYAHPKRSVVACPGCLAEYDVEQRREVLLAAVHDQVVTPAEAERALPELLGRPVKASTLRNWIRERRVVPEGYRHAGMPVSSRVHAHDQPLLLVGDIIREYAKVTAAEPGGKSRKLGRAPVPA